MFVHQSITSIEPLGPSPSFWSLEFYLRYFTKCLGRNLKNHPDCRQDHIFSRFQLRWACHLPSITFRQANWWWFFWESRSSSP